jgi:hypothetical protein
VSIGSVIIAAQQFPDFCFVRLADRQFVFVYHNDSGFQIDLLNEVLADDKTAVNLQETICRKFVQYLLNGHPDHKGLVAGGDNPAVVLHGLGEQDIGKGQLVKNLIFLHKKEVPDFPRLPSFHAEGGSPRQGIIQGSYEYIFFYGFSQIAEGKCATCFFFIRGVNNRRHVKDWNMQVSDSFTDIHPGKSSPDIDIHENDIRFSGKYQVERFCRVVSSGVAGVAQFVEQHFQIQGKRKIVFNNKNSEFAHAGGLTALFQDQR